jgi:tRNA threonylcarbamoyladenosine biosynthesis protein TsaB
MILAVETSSSESSIAVVGPEVDREASFESARQLATSLVPRIARLLDECGLSPGDIECLAVGIGPGSFTGLRAGVTTARALAHATGRPIVGIGSLEVLAHQVSSAGSISGGASVCCVVPSKRGEVYAAGYCASENGLTALGPTVPVALVDLPDFVAALPRPAWLAGAAFATIEDAVAGLPGVRLVHVEYAHASARALARLAQSRTPAAPFEIVPIYVRMSQAEAVRGEGPVPWRQAGDRQ